MKRKLNVLREVDHNVLYQTSFLTCVRHCRHTLCRNIHLVPAPKVLRKPLHFHLLPTPPSQLLALQWMNHLEPQINYPRSGSILFLSIQLSGVNVNVRHVTALLFNFGLLKEVIFVPVNKRIDFKKEVFKEQRKMSKKTLKDSKRCEKGRIFTRIAWT